MIKVLCDDFGGGDTGIGRYYREIIKRVPKNIEVVSLKINQPSKIFMGLYPIFLSWQIKKYKPDVFWSPGHIPPLYSKVPFLFTIHDLIQLKFYPKIYQYYYNFVIQPLLKKANKIITVSNASKKDIINLFDIAEDKVAVIPNGVSEFFFEPIEPYKIDKPYFLYVGNRNGYKNLPRVLTAFSLLQEDCKFLLTGKLDLEIEKLLNVLKIKDRVIFLGRLTEEQLRAVYKGAVASVLVSLDEGFGLTNLEALACGTNVVTSNLAAMPEVVGDQGILVDPFSIESIANGMSKALSQYSCRDLQAVDNRVKRARMFSWDETAKKVWEMIIASVEQN